MKVDTFSNGKPQLFCQVKAARAHRGHQNQWFPNIFSAKSLLSDEVLSQILLWKTVWKWLCLGGSRGGGSLPSHSPRLEILSHLQNHKICGTHFENNEFLSLYGQGTLTCSPGKRTRAHTYWLHPVVFLLNYPFFFISYFFRAQLSWLLLWYVPHTWGVCAGCRERDRVCGWNRKEKCDVYFVNKIQLPKGYLQGGLKRYRRNWEQQFSNSWFHFNTVEVTEDSKNL